MRAALGLVLGLAASNATAQAQEQPAAPAPAPPAPSPSYPPPAPSPWVAPQPAPYPWYPPPYPPYQPYPAPPPPVGAPPPPPVTEVAEAQPEPPYAGPYPSRASWSLQLESAQGVATGQFQNALLAGHVDYAFAARLKLGGYLAIANLKGKERRVSALLPCALVTYEKPPAPGRSLSFPIQFATGYLMQNGPVARVTAGFAWAAGRRTDLVFTAGPMVWVTRDDMLLSVDATIELRFRPLRNSETPRPP